MTQHRPGTPIPSGHQEILMSLAAGLISCMPSHNCIMLETTFVLFRVNIWVYARLSASFESPFPVIEMFIHSAMISWSNHICIYLRILIRLLTCTCTWEVSLLLLCKCDLQYSHTHCPTIGLTYSAPPSVDTWIKLIRSWTTFTFTGLIFWLNSCTWSFKSGFLPLHWQWTLTCSKQTLLL